MIWFETWILRHGLSRSSNLGQLRTANPPKNNIKCQGFVVGKIGLAEKTKK